MLINYHLLRYWIKRYASSFESKIRMQAAGSCIDPWLTNPDHLPLTAIGSLAAKYYSLTNL